jgi:hypothetical protein
MVLDLSLFLGEWVSLWGQLLVDCSRSSSGAGSWRKSSSVDKKRTQRSQRSQLQIRWRAHSFTQLRTRRLQCSRLGAHFSRKFSSSTAKTQCCAIFVVFVGVTRGWIKWCGSCCDLPSEWGPSARLWIGFFSGRQRTLNEPWKLQRRFCFSRWDSVSTCFDQLRSNAITPVPTAVLPKIASVELSVPRRNSFPEQSTGIIFQILLN